MQILSAKVKENFYCNRENWLSLVFSFCGILDRLSQINLVCKTTNIQYFLPLEKNENQVKIMDSKRVVTTNYSTQKQLCKKTLTCNKLLRTQ